MYMLITKEPPESNVPFYFKLVSKENMLVFCINFLHPWVRNYQNYFNSINVINYKRKMVLVLRTGAVTEKY